MTKQLKFTCMLLLVTSVTFAQKPQSIANTSKSTIKDSLKTDSSKIKTPPIEGNARDINTIRGIVEKNKIKDRVIVLDSTKTTGTTTQQAKGIIPNVGIVVKKNRRNEANRVIPATNEKGETEVVITEKGDYTFALSNIGGTAAGNNNAAAKSQGGPVIGVKVGLGGKGCCATQQPCCGKEVTAIANDKGEVVFKNLELGTYTLLVQAPCPFGHEWKDGKCVQVGDKTNNPTKQN